MAIVKAKDKDPVMMSAMIDVVFLLLIFFLVTYKDELIEARMTVDLPSPTPGETSQVQLLQFLVMPDQYVMNDTAMELDRIEDTLKNIGSYDTEQTVIIKVHESASHARLVDLLDRCKKVGFQKLNVLRLR